MNNSKLDRIINIIREDMMVTDPAKTNTPGFSASANQPVSGFDPIMDLRRKYGKKLNLFYRTRIKDIKNAERRSKGTNRSA
jgi:hypothetical protein